MLHGLRELLLAWALEISEVGERWSNRVTDALEGATVRCVRLKVQRELVEHSLLDASQSDAAVEVVLCDEGASESLLIWPSMV